MFSWHSVWILCIFYISSLCQMHNWWRLFFHSESCLITWMMLSFAIHICFSFTRTHLSVVGLYVCTSGVLLRKVFSVSVSSPIFLTFSSSDSSKHILCWCPCSIWSGEGAASRWECGVKSVSWEKEFFHDDSEDAFFILPSWRGKEVSYKDL